MSLAASCLYDGVVAHARSLPVAHAFSYRLCLLYLDLDELPAAFAGSRLWRLERPAPGCFRRQDYLPGPSPLADTVRAQVDARIGHRPQGAVRLLASARCFGHCFNPVVFFYCFSPSGALEAVVAEITNTPWRERFTYVCDCRGRSGDELAFTFPKAFHISPFMAMAQSYAWRFSLPAQDLRVHMENHEGGQRLFSASMALTRRVLAPASLDLLLLRHPLLSLRLLAGIYTQAARLWWKRVPVHTHPGKRPVPAL
jgi:uncharacterized protein